MDMNLNEQLGGDVIIDDLDSEDALQAAAGRTGARQLPQMMRRIPVTLQELMDIGPSSVLPLDSLAGEPLVIKVNGTPIGRAEVVVAGEQYGLKVIDLEGLNLDILAP
jgi:flagellar motor switch protein FliN/FliY